MTTKIQAIIYKIVKGEILCLCLKRSPLDGDFWHVTTGTVEQEETDEQCLEREIKEELGEQKILLLSSKLKEWVWEKGDEEISMHDYVVCLEDRDIILNEEHTEYVWLKPADAYNKYKYESAKEMVEMLKQFLF